MQQIRHRDGIHRYAPFQTLGDSSQLSGRVTVHRWEGQFSPFGQRAVHRWEGRFSPFGQGNGSPMGGTVLTFRTEEVRRGQFSLTDGRGRTVLTFGGAVHRWRGSHLPGRFTEGDSSQLPGRGLFTDGRDSSHLPGRGAVHRWGTVLTFRAG